MRVLLREAELSSACVSVKPFGAQASGPTAASPLLYVLVAPLLTMVGAVTRVLAMI